MRWLMRRRHVVAQDGDFRLGESPPLDARALRKELIRQCQTLQLEAPFSWRAYLSALFHATEPPSATPLAFLWSADQERPVTIASMTFGAGESARWVMQRQPDQAPGAVGATQANRLLVDGVRYTLLLPGLPDDEYFEHIVYHELGHLERGHLTEALAKGSVEWRCADVGDSGDSGDTHDVVNISSRWEQEAELFALTLTRLARGWDPALAPPSVAHFFDLLM